MKKQNLVALIGAVSMALGSQAFNPQTSLAEIDVSSCYYGNGELGCYLTNNTGQSVDVSINSCLNTQRGELENAFLSDGINNNFFFYLSNWDGNDNNNCVEITSKNESGDLAHGQTKLLSFSTPSIDNGAIVAANGTVPAPVVARGDYVVENFTLPVPNMYSTITTTVGDGVTITEGNIEEGVNSVYWQDAWSIKFVANLGHELAESDISGCSSLDNTNAPTEYVCSGTADGNRSIIIGNATPIMYTVTAQGNAGIVSESTTEINHPDDSVGNYPWGSSDSFLASCPANYTPAWTDQTGVSGDRKTLAEILGNTTIEANCVEDEQYQLTVAWNNATGTPLTSMFYQGKEVTLEGVCNKGHTGLSYSGDCTQSGNNCSTVMDGDKSVIANCSEEPSEQYIINYGGVKSVIEGPDGTKYPGDKYAMVEDGTNAIFNGSCQQGYNTFKWDNCPDIQKDGSCLIPVVSNYDNFTLQGNCQGMHPALQAAVAIAARVGSEGAKKDKMNLEKQIQE